MRSLDQPIPGVQKPISQHSVASSLNKNNSKIAAGPLSGNEVSQKNSSNVPIYLNDEDDDTDQAPSDTDDEEERLDCVHDIHGDGEEADVEEINSVDEEEEDKIDQNDDTLQDDRPLINDSSIEGDIEDADAPETDRRQVKRPSLFNKLTGAEQQSSVDSEHFKKKPIGGSKQFPLN